MAKISCIIVHSVCKKQFSNYEITLYFRGNVDHFTMTCAPLGDLTGCIVGAYEREDRPLSGNDGREAEWHCFEISVTDTAKGKK